MSIDRGVFTLGHSPDPDDAFMGDGYGPIVVKKHRTPNAEHPMSSSERAPEFLGDRMIAVPGRMTSAFLALQLLLKREFRHVVVPFDQIFDTLKDGRADAG